MDSYYTERYICINRRYFVTLFNTPLLIRDGWMDVAAIVRKNSGFNEGFRGVQQNFKLELSFPNSKTLFS